MKSLRGWGFDEMEEKSIETKKPIFYPFLGSFFLLLS
jgi:hypothetical protein